MHMYTRAQPVRAKGSPQGPRGAHKVLARMGPAHKDKSLGPSPPPFNSKPDPLIQSLRQNTDLLAALPPWPGPAASHLQNPSACNL